MSDVEWIDLGPPPAPAARGEPATVPDPQPKPFGLPAAVVALVTAALAVLAAGATWRTHRAEVVHTVVRTPTAYQGVAADGCPLGQSCQTNTAAIPALHDLVLQEFPRADLTDGLTVYDGGGRPVFTTISFRSADAVQVVISSQCVPDTRTVRSTLAPSIGTGPVDVRQVTSGAPGCSVVVAAHVPAGVSIPASQLAVLAIDPDLQLAGN